MTFKQLRLSRLLLGAIYDRTYSLYIFIHSKIEKYLVRALLIYTIHIQCHDSVLTINTWQLKIVVKCKCHDNDKNFFCIIRREME